MPRFRDVCVSRSDRGFSSGSGAPHKLPGVAGALVRMAFLMLTGLPLASQAWILNVGNNNPRRLFLTVGNGSTLADNATVNLVSLSVPAASVGQGPLQMTSNSTQANSTYDGFAMCTPPAQIYVGALYQRQLNSQPASARLQVTSPVNLTSGAGDTIPFTEISWTVSGPAGDANPASIPAGAFTGATQTLVTVTQGTLRDNCHTFRFANSALRPAGTYDGRVTYTLVSP